MTNQVIVKKLEVVTGKIGDHIAGVCQVLRELAGE